MEYNVQSKAVNNRISFFVKIENLSRALRSANAPNASRTTLKLTKKEGVNALSFNIMMLEGAQVLHEVPIRLVTDPRETRAYTEPPLGGASDAAVAVIYPAQEIRRLKHVVERMRTAVANDWMQLTARHDPPGGSAEGTRVAAFAASAAGDDGTAAAAAAAAGGAGSGSLELQVEKAEQVEIKTTFPRLGVPDAGAPPAAADADGGEPSSPSGGGGGEVMATASVEIKKLLRVLGSLTGSDLRIQNAIICVVPGSMVVLKIYLADESNESFIIYYLPVLALSTDD